MNTCSHFGISTHALTEGDCSILYTWLVFLSFQLTPSRRATCNCLVRLTTCVFQLTPSRRATPAPSEHLVVRVISTHALTEGDQKRVQPAVSGSYFNSRPHGGRRYCHNFGWSSDISTHALTEGDPPRGFYRLSRKFQLTPSRRATAFFFLILRGFPFQLTPSRRATDESIFFRDRLNISTHALTEGDP